MPDLALLAKTRVATATINAQTLTKQNIYTVPADRTFIPLKIVVRGQSASLAGLVNMAIGGNANADDWLQQISLNAMTATTDYCQIEQPVQAAGPPIVPTRKSVYAAGIAFGVRITTGSTGAATFSVDVFGYLF